jgi:type VI secretion system secreted protein VgrG
MSVDYSQRERIASLYTPFGADFLVLTKFEAQEGLSELFEYRIEALCKNADIDLKKLIGEKSYVQFTRRDGSERFFNGIVVEAQWLGGRDGEHLYSLVLRPWLWLCSQRADCRIFENKVPLQVIQDIFNKENKSDYQPKLTESYQTMEYCVQYRETDLDFVLRLMEQHGIYYYFEHSRSGHKLVLCDDKSAHSMSPAAIGRSVSGVTNQKKDGAYAFLPRGLQEQRQTEHIMDWTKERRLRTGRVELNDYDFKKSTANLKRSKDDGLPVAKKYEIFDYPGKYVEGKDGERFAQIRVQSAQAQDDHRYAAGDAVGLYPGALARIAHHPTDAENGEYLVIRCTHVFRMEGYRTGATMEGGAYQGVYEFMRSDRRFRAPFITPKPLIYGPQTAKVVGKKRATGEEIDVDEHGCILVQFHWDRDPENKTTSRRVRVAQVWSGKGWGGVFIPRIGQEVVVEHLEGDPDQPLVVGAVYNDQFTHPYAMPANKTRSGWKSNSSKGGGGFNELRIEDEKGSEELFIHAQKDMNTVVLDAETREIGKSFTSQKGPVSRKTTVKNGDEEHKIDSGSLLIEAKTKITLKVGVSKIIIEPSTITIDAPNVKVKSVNTDVEGTAMIKLQGGIIKIN